MDREQRKLTDAEINERSRVNLAEAEKQVRRIEQSAVVTQKFMNETQFGPGPYINDIPANPPADSDKAEDPS